MNIGYGWVVRDQNRQWRVLWTQGDEFVDPRLRNSVGCGLEIRRDSGLGTARQIGWAHRSRGTVDFEVDVG